jgi:hypothetical protein
MGASVRPVANEIVVTVSGGWVVACFESYPGAVNHDFSKLDCGSSVERPVNRQVFHVM